MLCQLAKEPHISLRDCRLASSHRRILLLLSELNAIQVNREWLWPTVVMVLVSRICWNGELNGWQSEMNKCAIVDPEYQRQYNNTKSETVYTMLSRLMDFLDRHDLYEKFMAEDTQGKRQA